MGSQQMCAPYPAPYTGHCVGGTGPLWLLGEAAQHPEFPLGPMQSAPRRSQLPRGWGLAVYSGRSPHLSTEPEAGEAVLWGQGPLSTLGAMDTGESDQ